MKENNKGIKNIKIVLFIIGSIFIIIFACLIMYKNTILNSIRNIEPQYWKVSHQISYEDKIIRNDQLPEDVDAKKLEEDGMDNIGVMDDIAHYIGNKEFRDSKYSDRTTAETEFKKAYPKKTHMYIYLIIGISLIIISFVFRNRKESK